MKLTVSQFPKRAFVLFVIAVACLMALIGFASCAKKECKSCGPGTCIEGECKCPENYSGDRCQHFSFPRPNKITYEIFDAYNIPEKRPDGSTWDYLINTSPDIYIMVYMDEELIYNGINQRIDNVKGDMATFYVRPPIVTDRVDQRLTIKFYDYDGGSNDELMDMIVVNPAEHFGERPKYFANDGYFLSVTTFLKWE